MPLSGRFCRIRLLCKWKGLSPERPKGLLATTKQIFLNMDDVDAIQAYVDTVPVKDLGGGVNYR